MRPSLSAFFDELEKIAGVGSVQKAESAVQAHHEAEKKDWKSFDKNLRTKRFQSAVISNPLSDDKLRTYAKMVGGYLTSKKVVATIPSSSSPGHSYRIKQLANGRLGCNCKNWQYVGSVEGSDCKHISEFKKTEKQGR